MDGRQWERRLSASDGRVRVYNATTMDELHLRTSQNVANWHEGHEHAHFLCG
ncbi:hypothetical protein DIPPA_00560 [Diplonema papillatum]|nr:hypothetical protein DIPPA_00560 [Diplonema papillatum]